MAIDGKDVKVITKTYKVKEDKNTQQNNYDNSDPNDAFGTELGSSA